MDWLSAKKLERKGKGNATPSLLSQYCITIKICLHYMDALFSTMILIVLLNSEPLYLWPNQHVHMRMRGLRFKSHPSHGLSFGCNIHIIHLDQAIKPTINLFIFCFYHSTLSWNNVNIYYMYESVMMDHYSLRSRSFSLLLCLL